MENIESIQRAIRTIDRVQKVCCLLAGVLAAGIVVAMVRVALHGI